MVYFHEKVFARKLSRNFYHMMARARRYVRQINIRILIWISGRDNSLFNSIRTHNLLASFTRAYFTVKSRTRLRYRFFVLYEWLFEIFTTQFTTSYNLMRCNVFYPVRCIHITLVRSQQVVTSTLSTIFSRFQFFPYRFALAVVDILRKFRVLFELRMRGT